MEEKKYFKHKFLGKKPYIKCILVRTQNIIKQISYIKIRIHINRFGYYKLILIRDLKNKHDLFFFNQPSYM